MWHSYLSSQPLYSLPYPVHRVGVAKSGGIYIYIFSNVDVKSTGASVLHYMEGSESNQCKSISIKTEIYTVCPLNNFCLNSVVNINATVYCLRAKVGSDLPHSNIHWKF